MRNNPTYSNSITASFKTSPHSSVSLCLKLTFATNPFQSSPQTVHSRVLSQDCNHILSRLVRGGRVSWPYGSLLVHFKCFRPCILTVFCIFAANAATLCSQQHHCNRCIFNNNKKVTKINNTTTYLSETLTLTVRTQYIENELNNFQVLFMLVFKGFPKMENLKKCQGLLQESVRTKAHNRIKLTLELLVN